MGIELDRRNSGRALMTTQIAPPPAPVSIPEPAPVAPEAPQPLAFKRVVVFASLREAVGCTAGA